MNKVILSLIFFILLTVPAVAQESQTEEADPLRDRVRAGLEEVKKNPKAHIGVITDKTDNAIQLRNSKGEIVQIAFNKEITTVARANPQATIGYEDIAIGDHIIAMGYIIDNAILEARRIVMYPNDPLPVKRTVIVGVVEKYDSMNFTITEKRTQKAYEVEPIKEVKVTTHEANNQMLSTIKNGQNLLVMGVLADNIISARRIHLLP
jgi:hypothetical protein